MEELEDFRRLCRIAEAIDCETVLVVPSPRPAKVTARAIERESVRVLHELSAIATEQLEDYAALLRPLFRLGNVLGALITMGGDPPYPPAPPPAGKPDLPMTLEEFYGGFTFHGPRMRAIESIEQISTQGIVGWVRSSRPADWLRKPARTAWTIDPLALDGAFQLAAYWAWAHLQRAGFPIGIEEYVQLAPLGDGPVRATLTLEQSAGDLVRGAIVLQSRAGRVVAVARGVQGEFKHRDPRFLIGRAAPVFSP